MTTVQQFRQRLDRLPGVEETQTWGHPTFRVRGKIFASLPEQGTAIVRTSPSEQQALVAADPATFAPAPRVGRFGWVQVHLASADTRELGDLVDGAWRRTAPRRLIDSQP